MNPQAASAGLAVLYLAIEGRSSTKRIRAAGAFLLGSAIVGGTTLAWLWLSSVSLRRRRGRQI